MVIPSLISKIYKKSYQLRFGEMGVLSETLFIQGMLQMEFYYVHILKPKVNI